ncbi:MAG: FecR family protein [Carboxylicivirga sp.]|jgi:hypothetical protein|nr:FecR family protein [Carboxylicivirga sp.]
MNIDENISPIIAKYMLGDLSAEEEKILKDWLSDPYAELLFRKIVDGKTIAKELWQLEAVDTAKAYRAFKRKTRRKTGIIQTFAYAAAFILPIGLGWLVWFFSNGLVDNPTIAKVYRFSEEQITLVEDNGKHHTISGKDTVVDLSDTKLLLKDDYMQYKKQAENTAKQPVYNTINIPSGKKYRLELSDGTIVHLNSETTMKYPVNFAGKTRNVQLISGEAFFDVKKHEKIFVLDFGNNKIKVLGTKFNVKSYKEEKRELITLQEGSISLKNNKNEVQLLPNQQAVIEKSDLSMKIEVVDAALHSDWRNGILNYKEQKLSTVLTGLERQYNVNMFYQNQDVKDKKVSISINTNKNISQVLKVIEATGDVKFKINNSNIIVMKK